MTYGGLIMPTVESVKKDIESLGTAGKEEILQYLEEVFVLGSFATEVTNEVKENRFSSGKVWPHCGHDEVSRNGKYNGKQRYICKSCQKTFTTLHFLQSIIVKKMLDCGYNMPSV